MSGNSFANPPNDDDETQFDLAALSSQTPTTISLASVARTQANENGLVLNTTASTATDVPPQYDKTVKQKALENFLNIFFVSNERNSEQPVNLSSDNYIPKKDLDHNFMYLQPTFENNV